MDGEWNVWIGWSVCSVMCGSGREICICYCNNFVFEYGGKMCFGNIIEFKFCYFVYCSGMGNFIFFYYFLRFFLFMFIFLFIKILCCIYCYERRD